MTVTTAKVETPPTRALRRGENLKEKEPKSRSDINTKEITAACASVTAALAAKYLLPVRERNCGSSSAQKQENELTWQHLEGGR